MPKRKKKQTKTSDYRKLTDRQKKFVGEYVKDKALNATKAAKSAGYRSGSVDGARLLANPKVRAEIDRQLAKQHDNSNLTAEKVIRELGLLAFSNLAEYVHWDGGVVYLKNSDELPRDVAACVESVSQTQAGIRIKLHNKVQALGLLLDHLPRSAKKRAITKFRAMLKGDTKD